MNRLVLPLLAVSLLAATGTALADPPRHAGNPHDRHGHDDRSDDHRDNRGHGHWKKGEHLPKNHRGEYLSDYHRYGLKAPPPGHQWRRVDGQYVLIAVTTGIIVSAILASH